MFRWPGKIRPGQVSNEMVAHLDLLPTVLAVAGDTEVKDKLLKGYKVGDMTYKVHLDGDNLVPHLTGQGAKSRGNRSCTSTTTSNWSVCATTIGSSRSWSSAPRERCASGRSRYHLAGSRRYSTSEPTPYERADITSNTYYDWLLDHAFLLVPAQDYVGQFLTSFRDYPQRQKAASFNMDEVMQKLKETGSK